MKRLFCILTLLTSVLAHAAGPERIYISTDRNAYLSGDRVWCSLFCMDQNGRFSALSSVAYVEVVSEGESVAEAKIGLFAGRGCGEFVLPASAPTGNYRILAYTSLGGAEESLPGSRIISIYNPHSTARTSGVSAGEIPDYTPAKEDLSDGIKVIAPGKVRQDAPFAITIEAENADVSVSVFHNDDLVQLPAASIKTFAESFPIMSPAAAGAMEYEGEIVRARVSGASEGSVAILSSAGSPDDTYMSRVSGNGTAEFVTGNIYGNREMVCEVLDSGQDTRIWLQSPFKHPSAGSLPTLYLHKDMFTPLVRRKNSASVQIQADTLVRFLPRREDRMLSGVSWEKYHLDDYVRFPSVKEILVEIVPTVRTRRSHGVPHLEVSVSDGTDSRRTFKDRILTMMDGVVVSDLDLILNFDAMLLDDVEVCREPVVSGNILFNGVVNFVTKNNYVTALRFAPQICVEDFKGVRFPVAYLGGIPDAGQDLREVLFWHPALNVKGRESISLTAPSYSGDFRVIIEGFTPDGIPVSSETWIQVQ